MKCGIEDEGGALTRLSLPPQMRQIMKKWADLKCDGKRRIIALRGPNGATIRKKTLGPVEKMVHEILMMSPRGGEEMFLHPGAANANFC